MWKRRSKLPTHAIECDESDAIRFYDAAWELGVPARMRQRFVV
jgi:hypothetical protein